MDNQDAIKYIISKLRAITTAVQIAPFVYTAFTIATLILYLVASEPVIRALDVFLYVSPIVVLNNLLHSKILKLCKWHKTACCLPLLPLANVLVDDYICEIPVSYDVASCATIIVMSGLLLIAAYNVFFK